MTVAWREHQTSASGEMQRLGRWESYTGQQSIWVQNYGLFGKVVSMRLSRFPQGIISPAGC